MPSQPEAQGDILKEFREGTFLSSLDSQLFASRKNNCNAFLDFIETK